MCGVNGILRLAADADPIDRGELLRTRDSMEVRGPDGAGEWISGDGRIGLGHRRLAIIDLSDSGLQPMERSDGRFRIVFNGEIYNYRELRKELGDQGVVFRTESDTEVILALYARDGARMLDRLRGMFALAIWDDRERRLLLARDPYGIKPLYYAESGGTLRFASQVKALEAGGAISSALDPAGVTGFLLWGSVPEPHTLRAAVRALPAGHYLEVDGSRVGRPQSYWSVGSQAADVGVDVGQALSASVQAHLVADVPVAVFLSAGLDSSLIAALASRQTNGPLTTLTLRFEDYAGTELDEAPLAAKVAAGLGTQHLERRVARDEFVDMWPGALRAMDQPSVDGLNTYVVSKVAHDAGFKVVLSGLGGDELFGSYASFQSVPQWVTYAKRLRAIPGLSAIWPTITAPFSAARPKLRKVPQLGASLAGAYFLRRGLYLPDELPGLIGNELSAQGLAEYDPIADADRHLRRDGGDLVGWEAVHAMESSMYMRNQLLRDSDWAAMAHSLELRVPLVDRWLRDAVAAADYEPGQSHGKSATVRQVAPELPEALWTRPKSGFSVPVMEWLGERIGHDTTRGQASRRLTSRSLALKVLEAFGVELRRAA